MYDGKEKTQEKEETEREMSLTQKEIDVLPAILAAFGVAITILAILGIAGSSDRLNNNLATETLPENYYPAAGYVTELNEEESIITVTLMNGNQFQFYGEGEDWVLGDLCAMIMDSKGTKYVKDDVVIATRYCGYLEERYVDMSQVNDYMATEDGLQLYLNNGDGYFWRR